MMISRESSDLDEIVNLLERAQRPLRRVEANRIAGRLSRPLRVDAGGMISLMFALQGDFRHAVRLVERVLPQGAGWTIEPDPRLGARAEVYRARMGEATAEGKVPALLTVAILLRATV